MGAWIETRWICIIVLNNASRPAWARGLKQYFACPNLRAPLVAPRMGAWIETRRDCDAICFSMSRPAWARGLKQNRRAASLVSRKSRPAWARGLKQRHETQTHYLTGVAPRMGAWIETRILRLMLDFANIY